MESEDADANVLGGSSFDYLEGLGEIPEGSHLTHYAAPIHTETPTHPTCPSPNLL